MLSVVFRTFGCQFAGATQLLPTGLTEDQKQQALEAFNKAVKVMYSHHGKVPALPQGSFAWKEFRVPTKNLLAAVSNCLAASMPEGFNLQKCVPSRPLLPRSSQADRIALEDLEKESMGLGAWAKDCNLYFAYNFASQTRYLDFLEDNSHYKLCFSADEGTEELGIGTNSLLLCPHLVLNKSVPATTNRIYLVRNFLSNLQLLKNY